MEDACLDPGLQAARVAAQALFAEAQRGTERTEAAPSSYFADTDAYNAERSEPLLLPGLLSPGELARLHAAARVCTEVRASRNADNYDFDGPDGHKVVYLHRDGFFAMAHARLCNKLVESMRSQGGGDPEAALNIRCVEYHTYPEGGGHLLAGHCDRGSELTMSVLLSHSTPQVPASESDESSDEERDDLTDFDGGRFITYKEGEIVAHEMARGDALLFRSEKLHNVSTVTRGTRHSLVIELWAQGTNSRDRFS